MNSTFRFGLIASLFFTSLSWAGDAIPTCLDHGKPLANNNAQIVAWKQSQPNQYRARGHVSGPISRMFSDATGHNHFEISIGSNADDVIEVIYNQDFGALPDLQRNDQVEACGDFIMATAQAGPYPPSPAGAIIHWVHVNPNPNGHESGYLVINGTLYGQDTTNAQGNPAQGNPVTYDNGNSSGSSPGNSSHHHRR